MATTTTLNNSSTYTPIYSTTLSSASASITLSNIPTTYTDLVLSVSLKGTSESGSACNFLINGDGSAYYSSTCMTGDGGTPGSTRLSSGTTWQVAYQNIGTSTGPSNFTINFMNYANTTAYKTMVSRYNEPTLGTGTTVGIYRSVSPITSITMQVNGSKTFSSGSTFTLYGIKAATPAPKATGGDVITTDGTYWYHAFKTTGVFDVKQALTADYLVVAGGGAGGSVLGSGGGAGGLRLSTSNSLTAIQYPVIVGAGGAGTQYSQSPGVNSSINSFVSTGGACGVTGNTTVGNNGGSGSGGNFSSGLTAGGISSPTTTPPQGNSGGTGTSDGGPAAYMGAGGGAGGAGVNATSGNSGTGGAGANTHNSITFTSWLTATGTGYSGYLAGGGGGANNSVGSRGQGGTGGGGTGGSYYSPVAGVSGVVSTGSGGGGGGNAAGGRNGGAGGSGLVIVRYAV